MRLGGNVVVNRYHRLFASQTSNLSFVEKKRRVILSKEVALQVWHPYVVRSVASPERKGLVEWVGAEGAIHGFAHFAEAQLVVDLQAHIPSWVALKKDTALT